MDVEPVILAEPDANDADSLVSENDPDDMANEQTWPTEEEMRGQDGVNDGDDIPDANNGTTPKKVRKVPKGMSSYQATWIFDDEEEDGEGEVADDEVLELEEEMEVPIDMDEADTDRKTVHFQDLEDDEEQEQ
jgi:pre-rRNA-processing protein TSR1